MSQSGEEMLNRINATLGVLQDAQQEAVEAVRDVAAHKVDPQAHGEAIAAAVEAAVSEALGGASGGGGSTGEDGEQLADRLSALENRFDGSGMLLAKNMPLTDAVNSATGTLAASDTAVKTAYDKASAAAAAAETARENAAQARTVADEALETAGQAATSAGTVALIGSRSSAGQWTLTGLRVGRPLIILQDGPAERVGSAEFWVTSGADDGYMGGGSGYQTGYYYGGWVSSNCFIAIPTATSVTINLKRITDTATLRAYQ